MNKVILLLSIAAFVTIHVFGQQRGDSYDNFNQKPNPNQAYFVIKSPTTGKEYFSGRLQDHKCPDCYNDITAIGDSLYERKNFADAVFLYNTAFSLNSDKGKVKHRYKAACAWVVLGNADSAFNQLNRLVHVGKYNNTYEISSDGCFQPLHNDKRWAPLMDAVEENARQVQEKLKKEMKQDG
ncbi:MAG: hypothetical protein WBP58_15135 [Chitinophagaceae bacterium]